MRLIDIKFAKSSQITFFLNRKYRRLKINSLLYFLICGSAWPQRRRLVELVLGGIFNSRRAFDETKWELKNSKASSSLEMSIKRNKCRRQKESQESRLHVVLKLQKYKTFLNFINFLSKLCSNFTSNFSWKMFLKHEMKKENFKSFLSVNAFERFCFALGICNWVRELTRREVVRTS